MVNGLVIRNAVFPAPVRDTDSTRLTVPAGHRPLPVASRTHKPLCRSRAIRRSPRLPSLWRKPRLTSFGFLPPPPSPSTRSFTVYSGNILTTACSIPSPALTLRLLVAFGSDHSRWEISMAKHVRAAMGEQVVELFILGVHTCYQCSANFCFYDSRGQLFVGQGSEPGKLAGRQSGDSQ